MMAKPFDELLAGWPAERLARIDARAKELIAEEMTLRDLRKARALTQLQLAKTLGIGQEHVSRLEKKTDMLLTTLASYVRAMGGDLRFLVEFPDRPPVLLTHLAAVFEHETAQPEVRRSVKKGTNGAPERRTPKVPA